MKTHRSSFWATGVLLAAGAALYAQQAAEAPATDRRLQTRPAVAGLHVMVPLSGLCSYEETRSLGELLARVIVAELPDITTLTRQVSRRGGKVYIDYLQNGAGRLLVSPFSVRALPGAPVSMPLRWSEVNSKLDVRSYTIKNAVARMKKLKRSEEHTSELQSQ